MSVVFFTKLEIHYYYYYYENNTGFLILPTSATEKCIFGYCLEMETSVKIKKMSKIKQIIELNG